MTLLMRDQENLEKGIEKGIERGIEKGVEIGILAVVDTLRDFNIPDDIILQKIQERFKLSKEEAEKYL